MLKDTILATSVDDATKRFHEMEVGIVIVHVERIK